MADLKYSVPLSAKQNQSGKQLHARTAAFGRFRRSAQRATAVLATTMVDRGDAGRDAFSKRGIPYEPLLTYKDLGIDPVG